MPPVFTHLVLSGGGFAALPYFGAIQFLQVEGMDKNIRNIAGTSMGALFATALALKIPLTELEKRVLDLIADPHKNIFKMSDVFSIIHDLGLDDGKRFIDIIRPEVDKLTFLDLSKKTGMNLVICATHITSSQSVYFSVDNTPNVLVSDAILASMAIPWFFKPVKIGDDLYVDGGVSDNVPFKPFENVSSKSILVFHCFPKPFRLPDDVSPFAQPVAYTISLLSRFFCQMSGIQFLKEKFPYYMLFDSSPLPLVPLMFQPDCMKLKLTKEDMDVSITYGYELAFQTLRHTMEDS